MRLSFYLLGLVFELAASQSLNEVCRLQNGKLGLCIPLVVCDYAQDLIKIKNQRPQHCSGFLDREPLLCCPREKSQIMCKRYYKYIKPIPVIYGGKAARPKEHNHVAAIGYGKKESNQWFCGGSLISEQFVLTAAHCVQSHEWGRPKWVRLGDLDLISTTDDAKPQNFAVSKTFVHPNYTRISHYHDVALLKLDKEARFDDYVQPACLHVSGFHPETLTVIGWGKTDYLGDSSSHLMEAFVFLIDNKKCRATYSSASKTKLRDGIVDSFQICAGHPEGIDTCPGDSGGPLQYENFNHFMVVGVTSFGKACGVENSAGVYARVSHYNSWIEDIVWPKI